jgi:dCTP deaminase
MILTGSEIVDSRARGDILIDPFELQQVNPNSYNVRLGRTLHRYTDPELHADRPNEVHSSEIPDDGLMLNPGELYLGHTVERIGSILHVPMLFGRSSVGRLGLFVEITAPIGDIGFVGQWTLMLTPVVPLRIYAEMEIGQIMFFRSQGAITLYSGKYQGAEGPRASQLWRHCGTVPKTP